MGLCARKKKICMLLSAFRSVKDHHVIKTSKTTHFWFTKVGYENTFRPYIILVFPCTMLGTLPDDVNRKN